MPAKITRLFTEHPASVNETYFQHMVFAGKFSFTLFAAGFAALIHAILPFFFDKTASTLVARLYNKTHNRSAE